MLIFRHKSFTQTSIKHFERNNEIQTGKAFRISLNNRPSGPSGWPEPKSQSFYPDHGTVETSPALCSVWVCLLGKKWPRTEVLMLCSSEVELRTLYTLTYNETVCNMPSSNTLDISLLAEGKRMLGTSWHKTKQDKCIKYHIVCITCCSSQSFSIYAVMSSLYHDFEGLSLINIHIVSLTYLSSDQQLQTEA